MSAADPRLTRFTLTLRLRAYTPCTLFEVLMGCVRIIYMINFIRIQLTQTVAVPKKR